MKKILGSLVLAVCCASAWAVDLPVPEELIGSQTVGIAHVHIKAFKFDQVLKTISDNMGAAPDPKESDNFKVFFEAFKASGGQGVSFIINAGKETTQENFAEGMVMVVTKGENAEPEKLIAMMNAAIAAAKDKIAPECPKEIDGSLVWYGKGYKLPKKSDDRVAAFSEAYSNLAKDASISVALVPDAETVEMATKNLPPDAPQRDATLALLKATGYCLFTDFGVAADPALKVLVLAADADGAGKLNTAVQALVDEGKKNAPPPIQAMLNSLKLMVAGSNVQVNVNVGDIVKTVKAMQGQ